MPSKKREISIYRKGGDPDAVMKAYDATLRLWKVPVDSVYISTSFGTTHVLVTGSEEAEPLVLLHGFAFSSTVWLDNIEALSRRYRVYAIDFPGDINKSRSIKLIKNKVDCAIWFTEMLDGLHVEKTNVCGHSYGGFIAMVLASRVSSRICKLIVLAPGGSFQKQRIDFFMRCLLAGMMPSTTRINKLMDYMTGKGNFINQTIKDQFRIAMQNALPRTKLLVSYIKNSEMKLINVPVLLLIGDQDIQYDAQKAIKRARKVIRDIEAIVIPNTGHGLPLEIPKKVNTLMLNFLDRKL